MDVTFNAPWTEKLPKTIYPCVELKKLVHSFSGGTPSTTNPEFWGGDIPWVSPKDFGGFYIEDATDKITNAALESSALKLAPRGAVLVVVRSGVLAHTLPVGFVQRPVAINQDIKALVPHGIDGHYLALYLEISGSRLLPLITKHSTTVQSINSNQFDALPIPLPPPDVQQALVSDLEAARAARKQKLAEAEALLAGVDDFVLQQLGLTAPKEEKRLAFAIRLKQIDEALNAERYINLRAERMVKGQTIGSMVDIVENKISPCNAAPDQFFDWIRIDDLPNHPLEVSAMRTELGKDIDGSLFEVQENDILVARLGPTILNAKFVLCPETNKRTVASGEFLVLRCREGWNPVAVLGVLRTKMFRDLMYSKARGGTPSRYRLNREDMATLVFPEMIDAAQQSIAAEVIRRRERARRLREEANAGWEAAKARFEAQLLGEAGT